MLICLFYQHYNQVLGTNTTYRVMCKVGVTVITVKPVNKRKD